MKSGIPVLDLFAGPGGLGEGFSRYERADGSRPFRIRLSIEKDPAAHATLTLRSFLRQFPAGEVPPEYSRLLRRQISVTELFGRSERASAAAFAESWLCELGATAESEVDARICEQLRGAEYWILIGGPPCQAYSLVGRSRMRSVDPVRFQKDPRHFLYREYLRILGRHRPAVFVMENVKGLLSATHEGACIFERVLADLAEPGRALGLRSSLRLRYRLHALAPGREPELLDGPPLPEDFVVRSELVGLPQARHRVILLGIREDIEARPRYLRRKAAVALRDVIGDLPALRSRLSDGSDSIAAWRDAVVSCAVELRRIFWRTAIADFLEERISRLNRDLGTGSAFQRSAGRPAYRPDWFADRNAEGIWGHVARSHIREDIQRYFFAAVFAACGGRSPVLADFPGFLLPNHRNVRRALKGGLFGDRFRVQVADRPATTITSHISKDGHYYIHPDPFQARSLTVREAARIQTFPDNYLFLGSRTAQYHQIGNAVPPLLALEIAAVVDEIGQGGM